jgi:hypothetical protein
MARFAARPSTSSRDSRPPDPSWCSLPVRAAADEVALEACTDALMDVRRLAFREFVLELSAVGVESPLAHSRRPIRARSAGGARHRAGARTRRAHLLAAGRRLSRIPARVDRDLRRIAFQRVDPARLRSCGESGPDLARLLDAYTRELTERRFADHAARVHLARDAFSASYNTLRQTAVVTLDLAPRSSLERELLAPVMGAARAALDLRIAADGADPATSLESLQRYLSLATPCRRARKMAAW